ncbi:uncharacterized protein LOC128253654 [Drosophila gunungcola]|uniref:uncharacterized protein LOC128253654 n=1 Tax=Drosophila gunungcola TaxID=103775 RepID=UPI0022E642D3|nr:uncharacterized protein LOC128253654 [Drosophila gunungcola]
MRSLRRVFAAAAVADFRNISPKLGPPLSWCPPPPPSTNFVKNLEAKKQPRNYLRLVEDPELPKLIKLYERVCRCSPKTLNGSTRLRRSELDGPPKKSRENYTKGTIRSVKINNFETPKFDKSQELTASKSSELSSKDSTKHKRFFEHYTLKKSRQKNKIPKQTTDCASLERNKIGSSKIKNPKQTTRKKNIKNVKIGSTKSKPPKQTKNIKRFENITNRTNKSYQDKRQSVGQADSADKFLNNLKFKNFGKSVLFKKHIQHIRSPSIGIFKDIVSDDDDYSLISEEDISLKEEVLRRISEPSYGIGTLTNISTISWLPKLVSELVNPVELYQFDPIDLEAYRDHFLSLHSLKPEDFRSSWTKIPWPKPSKPRKRNVKREDLKSLFQKERPLARKGHKSIKAATLPVKRFKYHSLPFEMWQRKRKRSKKTVPSQTKVVQNRCELCYFCRPSSQPDEPFMIEMKMRRDREALQQYYLNMDKRNQESGSTTFSDSKQSVKGSKPPANKLNCSSNLGKMRLQLEKCLAILNICGLLVDVRLRLLRCKRENRACRSGVGTGPEPN